MDLFIKILSNKYNLDLKTTESEWSEFNSEYLKLKKLKKPELETICKEKCFCYKGDKNKLIENIITKKPKDSVPENVEEKVKTPKKKASETIIEKIKKDLPIIVIKRNEHGNHVHTDSNLVFDSKTKKVIGKQEGDKIINLTKDDIEVCHKYNFSYEIPTSLDQKNSKQDYDDKQSLEDIMESAESDEESDEEIEY